LAKINILQITTNFNYSCGVSTHIFLILKELRKLACFNIYLITSGGDALKRLRDISINPVFYKFSTGWKNLLYLIPNYFALKTFCSKNNIYIIHSHHRYPEFLAWLVSKRLHIRTISTAHSIVKRKKYFSYQSDKVIAISKSIQVHLIHRFQVNPSKIILLHNFIDPQFVYQHSFLPSQLSGINLNSKKILLYIGRINKDKGVDVLINAFNALKNKLIQVILFIIGSNELNSELYKIIKDNDSIVLVEPQASVSNFYTISDVVILPSRVEALGYVMLEAGMFKKPFIGGNTDGIAEFIEHKKNGLLVEPGNVEALSQAIIWMLDHPKEAQTMGQRLHEKVMTLNSKEEYIAKLKNIYYELASAE